jgi:hypothetical protein
VVKLSLKRQEIGAQAFGKSSARDGKGILDGDAE